MHVLNTPLTWWRPDAGLDRSDSPGERLAFASLVTFTGILLLSPQEWFPVLQKFRIAFVAAGLAIAVYLIERALRRQTPGALYVEFMIALALVAWASLTAPLSFWPGGSVTQLVDPFLKAVAFFWLIATLITTHGRLRIFMWVLVLCSIPLSVSALHSYWTGDFLVTPDPFTPRITGFNDGSSGLAGNPNDLALTLNLMIPLAIALLRIERPLALRAVALCALLLAVAGVVVTFSRAGFLTLVLIVLLSLMSIVRRAPAAVLIIVMGLLVSTSWLLPSGYARRLTTITDIASDRTGSAQGRWIDLGVAADLAIHNAVIGVGMGQNVLALNRERGPTWRMVHNVYLQYAVDLGIPGLLLFLWLFGAVFRRVGEVRRVSTRMPALVPLGITARSVQIALCAFAVAALFYPVAYQFYFFLIAGLALAVTNVCRDALAQVRMKPASTTLAQLEPGTT